MSTTELEDEFVTVTFEDEPPSTLATESTKLANDKLYGALVDHSSAARVDTETIIVEALRAEYPDHALVLTRDVGSIFGFDAAFVMPLPDAEKISRVRFAPLQRRGAIPGVVVDDLVFEVFIVAWKEWEFKLYVVEFWPSPFVQVKQGFILHKGSEMNTRALILAAGAWANAANDSIWVYEGYYWNKDKNLWEEVQKANWADVILKQTFKDEIRNDVDGFYSQEKVYKELGIPWKRGIIMYGPPGNGKTISMKAIMKSCPGVPLYVRSFKHFMGPEQAMREVFAKARLEAPCLLVLEDLDALIDDSNRSFFLNQIDGLENNDGILVIATTNYLERLDPALSKRPSRFDRKMLFDDPDKEERGLYCQYWQKKLSSNEKLDFPDELVDEIASLTHGFSFAYLKEAFVSTLVLLATGAETRPFGEAVKATIKNLREQLENTLKPFGTGRSTLKQFVGL